MGCINAIVITLILIMISYSVYKNTQIILNLINLLGNPNIITSECIIWNNSIVKVSISYDTNLPLQLYFKWDEHIIRPREELYNILSKVCNDRVNYDIGSSKFTIKDNCINSAFSTMFNILNFKYPHQLAHL